KNATDPASPPAPSPCAPHAAPAPDRPDTAPPSPSAAAPAPATAPRAGLLPPPGSLRYPDSCSLIALLDKQTHEKSHKLFAQPCLMLTKTIPWSIDRPIGKGRQADHPHVDAHCCGRSMDWRFHLTLGLNRNHPSATTQAHRDVLNSTQHFPAVAISHPAKFGKQDAVVVLFQTAPLRIAKAGVLFLLLEDRLSNKLGPFDSALFQLLQRVQASCPRGIEVFQGLLQSLRRCLIQPVRLFVLLPVDQHSTLIRVAGMGPAEFEQLLLQGQCTIEDKTIQTDKPADELGPALICFLFATSRKSDSTRLWLQYQFLEMSIFEMS